MASNEHAFLSETNLHNPKGLSTAVNNTVCSKDNSGALAWTAMSTLKMDTLTFAGYSSLIVNYQYPEPMLNGQSPNEINKDYGSATISSGTTVTQKSFFRVANHVMAKEGKVATCVLQITSDDTNAFTVAIVKYSPTASATTVYPVVLLEKSVTGSAHNTVISYSLSTSDFAVSTVEPGDHLFLMVKANEEAGVGDSVHIVAALEIGCTDYA
jgi:hypothetical protein